MADSTNTDMPLTEGAWTRESDDPLTYEHDDGDLLRLKDSKHGHGVWFYDEGRDNLASTYRYGFYQDRDDAKARLKRLLGREITNLRGEVRQSSKAADDEGDVTLGKSDVVSAAYPVNGSQAEVLARHYDSLNDLRDATDAELLALDGIGQGTLDTLREKLADDDADGGDDEDSYTEGDVDTTVEPSGLDLDDPATDITGVGDSSNLAQGDTVGDFWAMGCPFHEVSPAWQADAFEDILGADFFEQTNPAHLIRLFAGYTAAYGFDEDGEELGNYAEALFGQFDWDDVRWAWADHGMSSDFGKVAAGSEVIEEQAALATGDELPHWELDFDPEQDTGLSGLHTTEDIEVYHDSNSGEAVAVHYTADIPDQEDDVYVPFETVKLYSLLFLTDFTDPANAEHVRLVVDTETSDSSKRRTVSDDRGRNNRYVAVFDHPAADVHGIAEGRLTVRPRDFDLTEPSEYDAWAGKVAQQVEERREAFEREMGRGPDDLRDVAGVAPSDQLEEATHTLGQPNADREDPNELDAFEEAMGDIYDPTEEVEEPEPDPSVKPEGDLSDPRMASNVGGKAYHFPVQIGDFEIAHVGTELVYSNDGPYTVRVGQHHRIADAFEFRLSHEDENAAEHGPDFKSKTDFGRTPKDFFEWFDGLEATGDADPVYPETEESSIARKEKPEDVAGYELVTNDPQGGMIEWEGEGGGTPPSKLLQQDYDTEVQLMNSGGRYKHRWLLRVHWRAGTDHKVRTIMQWKYAGTDGQDAARKDNMEKGIARAEEWMEENPAEGADDGDQPPTERVEAFADRTGVPADVSERIFAEFGKAVGKDWEHTEERIYQAADYGKERDRLLSVKGVGEGRQKQIAAADQDDDDDGTDLEATVSEIENAPPGGWTEEDRVDGGDEKNVYDAYTEKDLDPEKAREQIGRYLMATVPEDVARRLAETFGNTRSLAGATLGQLRDVEGVGDAVVREFYKDVPDDENLTIAHGQKRADWGPFSTFGGYGPRLEGKPEVGDYLGFEYDSGGMAGWVTRVEGDEALVRLDTNSQPDRYDWEAGVVEDQNGKTHDVKHVEVGFKQAPGDLLNADSVTGGFEVPEEDDLADVLAARGVNNIVAHNLADQYDSLQAVQDAAAATEDVTDLQGVGDASALQVRQALDLAAPDEGGDDQGGDDQGGDDRPDGPDTVGRWNMNDVDAVTGGYRAHYVADADTLAYSALVQPEDGQYVIRIEDGDSGASGVVAELGDVSHQQAVDAAVDYLEDTPPTQAAKDTTIDSTSGDRDAAEEHRKAVEAARQTDPDDDLPGPALKALKKNWGVYKRGLKEGREAVEEAEEYRDEHRGKAEEAAAIINDIRDAYGQEPIDFDGVEGVPAVEELGGPITAESSGVSLSFDWQADPYDPTEEV
ncbi:head protein [Haloarcula hispanica virus SH1]|uniref:ORF 13 n=1 Tax=Haloarcula hispanica SH1 virus TaxID=326574 RepID=Q4KPH4_9VIRU|nr:head protein [Haloarcula hispanica virus SH1]AAY24939.1 ORF 13 [Haloarcula hispanica virus SH1]